MTDESAKPLDLSRVTRFELIDATGRVHVHHYAEPGATIELQDDGRTLKLFMGRPAADGRPAEVTGLSKFIDRATQEFGATSS